MFCKLFDSPEHGQILVKLDMSPADSTPEVRFYVQPKNLGVCSLAAGFSDSDEGWDKAEALFAAVNEEKALHYIQPALDLATKVQDPEGEP